MHNLYEWQTSDWYKEPKGQVSPQCPKCGGKIRHDHSPRNQELPGDAHPPWNAGWDGTCEQCHHRFKFLCSSRLGAIERVVRVCPCNKPVVVLIDSGYVMSGVEITVSMVRKDRACCSEEKNTVFLGMAELLQLLKALEGELTVYQEQYDWTCDWT